MEEIQDERFQKVIEEYLRLTNIESMAVIDAGESFDILDDKIGGLPYIPQQFSYPVDEQGEPMLLLLQADLQHIDLPDWPKEGILEVFTKNSFTYPTEYQIYCFEKGLPYLEDLPETDLIQASGFVTESHKIELRKVEEQMPVSDYRCNDILVKLINEIYQLDCQSVFDIGDHLDFDIFDFYDGILQKVRVPLCSIGGYADFVQYDYREKQDERECCLFKLDSGFGEWVDIGDSGVLSITISPEDLKQGNFQKAFLDWDCY